MKFLKVTFIFIGFILPTLSPILYSNIHRDSQDKKVQDPRRSAAGEENATILLNGNAALDGFCAGNGTDGLSPQTAHIIANLTLNANNYLHSFAIFNTNRYLVLKNLTLVNASRSGGAGLYLNNVTRVNITSCVIENNSIGIYLTYSDWNLLLCNNVQRNSYGVKFLYADYNNLLFNNVSNNTNGGLYLFWSSQNDLVMNEFSDNVLVGVVLSSANDNKLEGNFIDNNTGEEGIGFLESCRNILLGNLVSNNLYGIHLQSQSDNNIFRSNEIFFNGWGIYVLTSFHNEFSSNNFFNNNLIAIWLDGSDFNSIMWNSINGSLQCIYIEWNSWEGYKNLVNWNFIWGNEGCTVISIPGNWLWFFLGIPVFLIIGYQVYRRRKNRIQ